MSFEYWLTPPQMGPEFLEIAKAHFENAGFERRPAVATDLSMSRPDADPSVEDFGGEVWLSVNKNRYLLTLNLGGADAVAAALAEALRAGGIAVILEEA